MFRGKILALAFAVLLFSNPLTVQAEILPSESKITQATVYPDAVLLTRTLTVTLTPGTHSVELNPIGSEIDENSLTVSGSGMAEVKLFGASIKKDFLKKSPDQRIKDLTDQIEALSDQILSEGNRIAVLDQEREFLNSVKLHSGNQIPKDLITKTPSAEELEGVLGFLTSHLETNFNKKQEVQLKVRDLQKQKETLERELGSVQGGDQKLHRVIVVDLECLKPGKLTLNVSYLVYGVNWYPVYDARVDFEKNDVQLTAFGVVRQNTGEDWKEVDLSFSTAKPSVGGHLTYVSPWILRPLVVQPMMPAKSAAVGGRMRAAADDIGDQYSAEVFEMANAPLQEKKADFAYSQTFAKGVSVNYKLARKATVLSDGSEYKFPVFTQALPANFEYSSYPRVNPVAYLGSRVTNAKDLQLLAGTVNIFLEGDFVGSSTIEGIGPGEEFPLYLGVDENIKIKREEVEKKVDDVLVAGIPSPNRKTTFKYKISSENYKAKAAKIVLFEAMPTSENERIRVKISDVNPQPKEKDWENRLGIWRWEFLLEPKAKQEIFYTFIVEHPRDMQVEGL